MKPPKMRVWRRGGRHDERRVAMSGRFPDRVEQRSRTLQQALDVLRGERNAKVHIQDA
jgi:hypothetical protein